MIRIETTPMGAVRMTRRGKFVSIKAQRYLNFKNSVGWQLKPHYNKPLKGALKVDVTFILPVPDSWSGKKKREHIGAPVTVKPDADNLVKALMDAANKIVWLDDNQVSDMVVRKRYGYEGAIEITVTEVGA
jgi:Holliday junction resolvase RusA-like endonuclease